MTGLATHSGAHSGVVYAPTRQGYALPVVDVTHPCFVVPDDATSLDVLRGELAVSERRRKRVPKFLMKWMLRSVARRSLLARELLGGGAGSVLSGLTTYVMKLGTANLVAPFNTPVDRRMTSSPGTQSMRIRLQQLVRLMAEGVRNELAVRGTVPLHLINIGGGTAIDSLNTLILLRKSDPAMLERRPVHIHVLDPDSEGPEFGAQALAALTREGAPLQGLELHFAHIPYDWKDTAVLANLVRGLSSSDSLIAASSEGALFEYGDDATVLANLEALRSGSNVALVGGTVTREDPIVREFITVSRFKLVPRGAEQFGELVKRADFAVTRVAASLLSDQVLLHPIRAGKGQ